MRLRKKYPFERQKALEVCRDYYQAKGYSEEHCHNYIDHLEDWVLENVYNIICEELENGEREKCNLL